MAAIALALGLQGCHLGAGTSVLDGSELQAEEQPSLRFVALADTKSGTDVLAALSRQAQMLGPAFAIVPGDLESAGFTRSGATAWKKAMDGDPRGATSDGMFARVLAVRGNHDGHDARGWLSFFEPAERVAAAGGSHYEETDGGLSYSFDVANAHFVAVDVPGDVDLMTAAQTAWIDGDLGQAEARGVTHSFLFWHGPLWGLADHCCGSTNPGIVEVFNRHPSVSATFHGHEHVNAWTHIGRERYPGATREFEQLVSGRAGAEPVRCLPGRADYCQDERDGFLVVDVKGPQFTVSFYVLGQAAPVRQLSFSKR